MCLYQHQFNYLIWLNFFVFCENRNWREMIGNSYWAAEQYDLLCCIFINPNDTLMKTELQLQKTKGWIKIVHVQRFNGINTDTEYLWVWTASAEQMTNWKFIVINLQSDSAQLICPLIQLHVPQFMFVYFTIAIQTIYCLVLQLYFLLMADGVCFFSIKYPIYCHHLQNGTHPNIHFPGHCASKL